MGKRKVAIVGAGFVGASIAYALTLAGLAREIVLIDIKPEAAYGEALDIRHGIPYMGNAYVYEGDYSDCAGCDLIIITAGRNRKPGESRLDLAEDNISIVKEVTGQLMRYYTRGVVMVVTNPVDIITHKLSEWVELSDGMVFGTGCILDTSRLISCVADYIRLGAEMINGFVAGEHGDGLFPVWSRLSIAGSPIDEYCRAVNLAWGEEQKAEITAKVKRTGGEIILGKGRTQYGIATCVCYLADAILNRRSTVVCVSSVLKGEYGISDVALSVPSILGVNGVEKRLEEIWSTKEREQLEVAAVELRKVLQKDHGIVGEEGLQSEEYRDLRSGRYGERSTLVNR